MIYSLPPARACGHPTEHFHHFRFLPACLPAGLSDDRSWNFDVLVSGAATRSSSVVIRGRCFISFIARQSTLEGGESVSLYSLTLVSFHVVVTDIVDDSLPRPRDTSCINYPPRCGMGRVSTYPLLRELWKSMGWFVVSPRCGVRRRGSCCCTVGQIP